MIVLDYSIKRVKVYDFKSSELEIATKIYIQLENEANKNVVLTSANSFNTLKEAYPNYFADISEFIKMVREIIKKYGN